MHPQEQPAPTGDMRLGAQVEHATDRDHGYVASPIGKRDHWHLTVKIGQCHRPLLDIVSFLFHCSFLRLLHLIFRCHAMSICPGSSTGYRGSYALSSTFAPKKLLVLDSSAPQQADQPT